MHALRNIARSLALERKQVKAVMVIKTPTVTARTKNRFDILAASNEQMVVTRRVK